MNNASVDGLRGFPWDPAYSAAKHGVLGLTKSVAVQYARLGVCVNAVSPAGSARRQYGSPVRSGGGGG